MRINNHYTGMIFFKNGEYELFTIIARDIEHLEDLLKQYSTLFIEEKPGKEYYINKFKNFSTYQLEQELENMKTFIPIFKENCFQRKEMEISLVEIEQLGLVKRISR